MLTVSHDRATKTISVSALFASSWFQLANPSSQPVYHEQKTMGKYLY